TGGAITPTFSGAPTTVTWSGMPAWGTWSLSGANSEILNFTAPKLTDFQNFEDVPGVAVLERTTQGRVQLTLSASAGGANDQILVNFSVGPFPSTVANENVALGTPVFLNGAAMVNSAAITSWTWSGRKPDGNPLTSIAAPTSDFKTPDKQGLNAATNQRFVYFVPNQLGTYEIQVSQTPGPVVQVINI